MSRRKNSRFLIGYGIFLCFCALWAGFLWKEWASLSPSETRGTKETEQAEKAEIKEENIPYPTTLPPSQRAPESAAFPSQVSPPGKVLLSVPYLSQENRLPTGCEAVSTVMLLQYYSIWMDTHAFIDRYLDCGELEMHGKMRYGPDPNEAFVGSPYRSDGFGCYAPVIQNALEKLFREKGSACQVKNTTGSSLEALCSRYVAKGTPVLVWASINMVPIEDGLEWFLNGSGELFTWTKNEHCLVLVGYDTENYYFNDPYQSNGVVSYEKELVNQRYREMNQQSLIIESGAL